MGRRIGPPLASWIVTRAGEAWGWDSRSGGTLTATNADSREEAMTGKVVRKARRRFQAWKEAVETPSFWQNWWIVRPLSGCCRSRRRQRISRAGSAGRGMV